jgi:hypothetical protein
MSVRAKNDAADAVVPPVKAAPRTLKLGVATVKTRTIKYPIPPEQFLNEPCEICHVRLGSGEYRVVCSNEHAFHTNCIQRLIMNTPQANFPLCPVCREDMLYSVVRTLVPNRAFASNPCEEPPKNAADQGPTPMYEREYDDRYFENEMNEREYDDRYFENEMDVGKRAR